MKHFAVVFVCPAFIRNRKIASNLYAYAYNMLHIIWILRRQSWHDSFRNFTIISMNACQKIGDSYTCHAWGRSFHALPLLVPSYETLPSCFPSWTCSGVRNSISLRASSPGRSFCGAGEGTESLQLCLWNLNSSNSAVSPLRLSCQISANQR